MNAIDKDVEREDRNGVGRGSKIGLAIIAVLAMIFLGLLVMKLSGTDDTNVANGSDKKTTAHHSKDKPKNKPTTWSVRKERPSSFDEPTVVSPAPKKARYVGSKRSKRWSLPTGGTSPDMSMMPSPSAGSSSANDVAVETAPLPSKDKYKTWGQPSTSGNPARQTSVPADVFAPRSNQSTNSPAYPNYDSTPNQSYTGGSSYPPYPPNPSTGSASSPVDNNPYRGRAGLDRHRTDYPTHDSNPQTTHGYSREQYGSNARDRHDKSGYEPAPYSQKKAHPYRHHDHPYKHHDHSSSSTSTKSYDLKSYHDDPYQSPMHSNSSIAGLGDRRDDGKYVVGPNESFSTIAEKLYGTDAFYQALAEFNRNNYPDENRLRVGDVIIAPDESELVETYPDLCPSPERRKVIRSRISAVSTRPSYRKGPTYTVQQGDTLFDIARYKLGNGARWPEIFELNQDVLQGDFNYVTPGIVLALPEDGSSDAVTQRPASRRFR